MTRRPRSEVTSGRQRWRAVDAQAVLERWRRSELSLAAFADQEGLQLQRLAVWRRRLDAEPLAFREIAVRSTAAGEASLELRFPSGLSLRVGAHFDADALRRLVAVLTES